MLPGANPEVCCIRCKDMACPKCIRKEIINHVKLKYICDPCENIISNEMGLDSISEEHLKKGCKNIRRIFS